MEEVDGGEGLVLRVPGEDSAEHARIEHGGSDAAHAVLHGLWKRAEEVREAPQGPVRRVQVSQVPEE